MRSRANPPLGVQFLVRGGVRGFDYGQSCDRLVEACGRSDVVRVITPGNLRAYCAPAPVPVRLAGRTWRQPCLAGRPEAIPPGLWQRFTRPKVVVKGVGPRPTAALVAGPAALFVAVWGIWVEDPRHPLAGELAPARPTTLGDDGQGLWALLALLNSLPAAWLHYQELAAARIPRGSHRIPMSWLGDFPVPAALVAELGQLARRRMVATTGEEQQRLQHAIDAAAARAYGLAEADLALMAKAPVRPVQT